MTPKLKVRGVIDSHSFLVDHASVTVLPRVLLIAGSVYFAECGLRNFNHVYFDAESSANYTLFEFRIPQNTVSRYARQNGIVISRT